MTSETPETSAEFLLGDTQEAALERLQAAIATLQDTLTAWGVFSSPGSQRAQDNLAKDAAVGAIRAWIYAAFLQTVGKNEPIHARALQMGPLTPNSAELRHDVKRAMPEIHKFAPEVDEGQAALIAFEVARQCALRLDPGQSPGWVHIPAPYLLEWSKEHGELWWRNEPAAYAKEEHDDV